MALLPVRASLGRASLVVALAALLLVAAPKPAWGAQGCGIGVQVQPPTVNWAQSSLPSPRQTAFAEVFDVNYTSSYDNRTLALEYLNGSTWTDLQTFQGNAVGFTEIDYGVNSAWASFGTNAVRVTSGGCSSDVSRFQVSYDSSAILSLAATYGAIIAFAFGFLLLGRRLGWKRFLVLAVPAYLLVAPWTGQRYDMYFLLSSGMRVLQHVNPFNPGSPPIYPGPLKWAYPPLYIVYSALSFLAYQGLTGSALPSVAGLTWPGWLTSTYNVYQAYVPAGLPVLALLLKLPMIASAVLTGVLLKRMTGDGSAAIWWVANPLVILVSAVWGQLDPIAVLLAVGAVYYFQKDRPYPAYLLASFGAAVKVWPALLIPLMLAISLRKRGLKALKPTAAVIPAVLVTVALYAAYGDVLNSVFVFLYARGIPTFAGAFSVNGLTWQEALFVLKSPPVPAFLFAGVPAYVAVLAWVYWKRDADIVKWTVVSLLIFYLTYNYVNPQYFLWILPFLILQKTRRLASVGFTILPLAFMGLAYNVYYFVSPALLPDYFVWGASILDQLKVSVFYQNAGLFLLVTAVIPTLAYLTALRAQLTGSRSPAGSDGGNV